jgi:TolB protein
MRLTVSLLKALLIASAAVAIVAPANAQIVLGGEPVAPPGVAAAPLRLDPDAANVQPVAIAIPDFDAASDAAQDVAAKISGLVRADLAASGLFRILDKAAYAEADVNIGITPQYGGWASMGAQALVVGNVAAGNTLAVQFRLFDAVGASQLVGTQYAMPSSENWRRVAHKIADDIYKQITGKDGYFDSRITFLYEDADGKRTLGMIDQDGANSETLLKTVLNLQTPHVSPSTMTIVYSGLAPIPNKATGAQQTTVLYDVATGRREPLISSTSQPNPDAVFSPDGRSILFSRGKDADSDIYLFNLAKRTEQKIAASSAADTSPTMSPDGSRIAFVSGVAGSTQIYTARVDGADQTCSDGAAAKLCRISSGDDAYTNPAWSPDGKLIVFSKSAGDKTRIGVIGPDGKGERLLTEAFLDASPTWSPNSRVIAFARTSVVDGPSQLWTVDVAGRNLRQIQTPMGAVEPHWGPLQK